MHRAIQPLSTSATKAANAELYRRHPELVTDGKGRLLSASGAQDAQLRSEWMALYMKAGGAVEPVGPKAAKAISQDVANSFSTSDAGSGVAKCPLTEAKPPPAIPAPPRALPPQPAETPVCELLTAQVTCKHGRKIGPERILMVVAQGADATDSISASSSMKGGCGAHPEWAYGPSPSGSGKSGSLSFEASCPASLSVVMANDWKTFSPKSTRITMTACAGISGDAEVRAYPAGKASMAGEAGLSYKFYPRGSEDAFSGTFAISQGYERENISADKFKLDFLKFVQKFTGAVADKLVGNGLPSDDDGLYPSYPRPDEPSASKKPKSEGKVAVRLSGSADWEWKEDPGNWTAHCESTQKWGAAPLIEASGEFPLYGPPIPPKLKRWVDLGLYAGAGGKISLNWERITRFWPHTGTEQVGKWEAKGDGELEFSLFVKIQLVSEDFISGSAGGKTGFKVSAAKAASGAPQIEFKREWTGLKAALSGEAVWGLFSYEREFVLFEPYKFINPWIWTLK